PVSGTAGDAYNIKLTIEYFVSGTGFKSTGVLTGSRSKSQPKPDLTLKSSDISVPSEIGGTGEISTEITAFIHNFGGVNAGGYYVRFRDLTNGQVIGGVFVNG